MLDVVHVAPHPLVHHVVVHDVGADRPEDVGVVVLGRLERHQAVGQPFQAEVVLQAEVALRPGGHGEVNRTLPLVVGDHVQRRVVVLGHVRLGVPVAVGQGPLDLVLEQLGFLGAHQP